MFWDPLMYFSSLLVCVFLGNFYTKIQSTETKRNYGTGIGLLVVCLICGSHILHTIFLVLGNTIIIRCCHKSYVHRISFMYSWLLLLYFHFNVTLSKYELWIFQILTLRMVGMAFEVNLAYKYILSQESLKKTPQEAVEMKTLLDISREHSTTSSTTRKESTLKEGRENLHTKAGSEVASDLRNKVSSTEGSSTDQKNAPATKSTNARLSTGNVLNQTVPSAARRAFVSADAKAAFMVREPNDTRAEKMSNATDNRRETISESQNKAITYKIRLAASMLECDVISKDPTAIDIISYAYFFVGLHKGPYYRWKVFDDHFYNAFGVLGNCHVITEHKLKKALICSCAYILLRMKYDPNIYFQSQFYEIYNTDFRYLYSMPQLIMFFLTYQIVMLLCTAVCTESGFGVYPAKTQPVPGHGPTASLGLLKLASTTATVAMEQEYNFAMLKCFENEKLFLGPRMADTMRSWDMSTRYWFKAYAYKNFMKSNKEVRSAFTFLCWTIWLTPSIQQFIVSITLWIYMHLEKEFVELYDTTGSLKLSWSMGFSIMRMMCLVYLTPCLVIDETESILRYYTSINWIYHIVLLVLIVYAIVVSKFRANNVV